MRLRARRRDGDEQRAQWNPDWPDHALSGSGKGVMTLDRTYWNRNGTGAAAALIADAEMQLREQGTVPARAFRITLSVNERFNEQAGDGQSSLRAGALPC